MFKIRKGRFCNQEAITTHLKRKDEGKSTNGEKEKGQDREDKEGQGLGEGGGAREEGE